MARTLIQGHLTGPVGSSLPAFGVGRLTLAAGVFNVCFDKSSAVKSRGKPDEV